jgi:hypothetical protein
VKEENRKIGRVINWNQFTVYSFLNPIISLGIGDPAWEDGESGGRGHFDFDCSLCAQQLFNGIENHL